jgi:shikimate kinase
VICRKVNRTLIKKSGLVVWLKAKPAVILRRILKAKGARPLLNNSDPMQSILDLLEERGPYYRQCSHLTIQNNGGAATSKLARIPQIHQLLKHPRNGTS